MDTFSPNTIGAKLARLSVYSDAPVSVEKRADVVLEQIHRQLAPLAVCATTHLVTFQSDGLPNFYDVINLVIGALEKSGFACTGDDGKGKFGAAGTSGLWCIRVVRTPGLQVAKAEKDPRNHYQLLLPGSDLMDELTACTFYKPDPLYTPDGLITRAAACIQKIIAHIRSQESSGEGHHR